MLTLTLIWKIKESVFHNFYYSFEHKGQFSLDKIYHTKRKDKIR